MLTPVQLFYVEQHADRMSAEELARAVDVDVRSVKAALKRIAKDKAALAAAQAQAAPPEPAPAPERKRMPAVVTTEAISHRDDKQTYRSRASKIPPRLAADVRVVDPSQPVY